MKLMKNLLLALVLSFHVNKQWTVPARLSEHLPASSQVTLPSQSGPWSQALMKDLLGFCTSTFLSSPLSDFFFLAFRSLSILGCPPLPTPQWTHTHTCTHAEVLMEHYCSAGFPLSLRSRLTCIYLIIRCCCSPQVFANSHAHTHTHTYKL